MARLGGRRLREKKAGGGKEDGSLGIGYQSIEVSESTGNASEVNRTEQLQQTCAGQACRIHTGPDIGQRGANDGRGFETHYSYCCFSYRSSHFARAMSGIFDSTYIKLGLVIDKTGYLILADWFW